MLIDTRTLVLISQRLTESAGKPSFFNDRMTPARLVRRLGRVLDWMGSTGRIVAADHIRRREIPPPGKRMWARGGYRSDLTAKD